MSVMNQTHRTLIVVVVMFVVFGASPLLRRSFALTFAQRMSGRILIQVEGKGEAWYVYPVDHKRYYLGRPADAFEIMRRLGLGVRTRDVERYRVAVPKNVMGKIVIDVDDKGKAYYLYPVDASLHYLGLPSDAFQVMRTLGLGIKNSDLQKIPIGTLKKEGTASTTTTSQANPQVSDTNDTGGGALQIEQLRIASAIPTVERETQSDGQVLKHIHMDVIVEYPALQAVDKEWKMNVTLDAQTVDAQAKSATFFVGSPLSTIKFQSPYKLPTATFVLDARVPESYVGVFTTTLTAHDVVGGTQDVKVVTISL